MTLLFYNVTMLQKGDKDNLQADNDVIHVRQLSLFSSSLSFNSSTSLLRFLINFFTARDLKERKILLIGSDRMFRAFQIIK